MHGFLYITLFAKFVLLHVRMCVYCVAPEMLVFGGPLLEGTVQTFSEGVE